MQRDTDAGLAPEFVKALELYGLAPADLKEELVVPPRAVVTLSAGRRASHCRPKMLQTGDLAELKRWIGVPDRAVKGRCLLERSERTALAELRRPATQVAAGTFEAKAATASQLEAIRAHARAYLYGDSTLVAEAKPLVERQFEAFLVALWLFTKIKVSAGSVLSFGPGANVLLAGELEIEEGGQVVSYGPLTVRVSTLRKTAPKLIYAPMDLKHALALLRA